VFVVFSASVAMANSPAEPIKSKLPICQEELTQREKVWSTEYNTMMSDIVINLHLGSLMELRETAIKEGNMEVYSQIDQMIAKELQYALHVDSKASNFKIQLKNIKNALEVEPLMVESLVRERINEAFEAIGV
jgi:hypothetical protein